MKSIWNGTISFGLVTIPVRMYSAVEKHSLGFKMLHNKCKNPVEYERWCPVCNKEVLWEDIVKGLKTGSQEYLILTKEKIKELRPEKTDNIDVLKFVDFKSIDVVYYDGHYFLGPDTKGSKAYYLLFQALKETGKTAVGRFVMRDKEYLCVLTPYEDSILLTTLNYEYEIRDPYEIFELSKKRPSISKTELDLAIKLINQSSEKKFDISRYKDTFAVELEKALRKGKRTKISSKKSRAITAVAKSTKKKEDTLMSSLKKSISEPKVHARKPVLAKKKSVK